MLKNRAFLPRFWFFGLFFAQFLVILYRMALRRIMLFNTFTVSGVWERDKRGATSFPRGAWERVYYYFSCLLCVSWIFLLRQFFIFQPMRGIGITTQTAMTVGFVILIIAFKPDDLAVAFKCQNVGGDTV